MTGQPTVVSLQRYPVKSMLGLAVDSLDLDARGVVGDRRWSVRTVAGKMGSGKNSRRFAAVPGLLDLRATDESGAVVVRFPDGTASAVDDPATADAISRHVGQPVTLAEETDVSHFDDGAVSLLGIGSLDALVAARQEQVDAGRFRANIVFAGASAYAEDGWVDRSVRIGSAVLHVQLRSTRCVMVDMSTADLPAQPGNLRELGRLNDTCLGVIAGVVQPGTVSVGDAVELLAQ